MGEDMGENMGKRSYPVLFVVPRYVYVEQRPSVISRNYVRLQRLFAYSLTSAQEIGSMGIRVYGNMEIWGFGNLGIWGLGDGTAEE
jgi:hypothetical protein